MKEKVRSIFKRWATQYQNNVFLQKLYSLLGIDILAKALSVLLLPVYLWIMSQEEYGVYNYIITIISTFSVILNFGLYVSQSKYYSDADTIERKGTVLFNIFILLTLFLTVALLSVYATGLDYFFVRLLFKNNINYTSYRWLILLAILVSVYTVIITNYMITSEKITAFRRYNVSKLIVVNIVVAAALYLYDSDKIHARLLYTYILELLVLLFFSITYIREMWFKIDRNIMVAAIKLGTPFMFGAIWSLLTNYSDKFFLEKYGTPKHLSYYYLAFSISNILLMITTAAHNAWLPMFLKEKDIQQNITNTKKLLSRLSILLAGIGVLLMVGLLVCLELHIISENYRPALYILPILVVGQVLNGILTIYGSYVIYFEKAHWSMFVGMATAAVGTACSFMLIPTWNVYGAATVYLIVQLTYLGIFYVLIQRKIKKVTLHAAAK